MKSEMMDPDGREELAEAFFALSNPIRLGLLYLLTEPHTRSEVAQELEMTRQSASKHLGKLQEYGFVEEFQGWRDSGPVQEFQVDPKGLFAFGMTLVDLGKLEPEGGPEEAVVDPTQMLAEQIPRGGADRSETVSHLLILDGPLAGERFPIEGDGPRWTIGRAEDRDLCLEHDPYISSRQCEIQLDPAGYAIVDTHSANGTLVNFAQLPEGGRTALEPGDVIRIGRTNLVFQQS